MSTVVLKGGRIIDPANCIDQVADLIIIDGKIAPNTSPIPSNAEIISCAGKLVIPGLIDTHAHVFKYVTGRFGLDADT